MYFLFTVAAIQAVLAWPAPEPIPSSGLGQQLNTTRFPPEGLFFSTNNLGLEVLNVPSYYPGGPWFRSLQSSRPNTCNVSSAPNGGDSAPAILAAFKRCGQNGIINFNDPLYTVKSVMNTSGLSNVEVNIRGTLLWDTNITYWLSHSLPVGYQNQSSAWIFGGDRVWLQGHGLGTLNGNGQVWYDFIGAGSNYPGRPHAITFAHLTNSLVAGLNFFQSQMWTMALIYSSNVLLQDIHVNNTNLKGGYDQNTDGADTIYSSNITFVRWTVANGDDSISMKANSTNMLVENCTFHGGGGMAMGSIGQYFGRYETIQNIVARDIFFYGTVQVGYVKTWTGIQKGYPPNGGGGGIGVVKNITFTNFTVEGMLQPWYITQCISYNGQSGGCDTSKFQIRDLYWSDVKGVVTSNDMVNFQCSAAAPCKNINVSGMKVVYKDTNKAPTSYLCSNVKDSHGFKCNGKTSPS